ncbi:hypothetical protein U0070_013158, partial [Myodes glareolus]
MSVRDGGQTMKNTVRSVSEEDGVDVIENGHDTEALEIDYVEVCKQDEKSAWSKENAKGDTLSAETRMEINIENAVWSVTAECAVTMCKTGKKMVEGAFNVQNTH